MPFLSTTSAHSEFVPRKNKSCIWSQSRDMVTYIVSTFESFLSRSDYHPDSSITRARTASDISPRITSGTQPEMGASKNTCLVLMKLVHLSHFKMVNFRWTSKSPHTFRYTCLVSGQTNTSLLWTLSFHNFRTHRYIRTKHMHIRIIYVLDPPPHIHTRIHNK